MPNSKTPRDPQPTDSDRAVLEELVDQARFDKRLADLRAKRKESVKSWALWVIAVFGAIGLVKEPIGFIWTQFKAWAGLVP